MVCDSTNKKSTTFEVDQEKTAFNSWMEVGWSWHYTWRDILKADMDAPLLLHFI